MARIPVVVAAALAFVSACTGRTRGVLPPPAPPPEGATAEAVPLELHRAAWRAGERMQWSISMHGVRGARAVLMAGEPGDVDGHRAIILKARVRSVGIVESIAEADVELASTIDVDTEQPLASELEAHLPDEQGGFRSRFDHDEHRAQHTRWKGEDADEHTSDQVLPAEGVYDAIATMGVFRAWVPDKGTRAWFYAIDERRIRRHEIVLSGYGSLQTSLGYFRVARIDGEIHGRTGHSSNPPRYTVYVSNDADRLPLLLEIPTEWGKIKMELVDYDRPELRRTFRSPI